MRERAGVEDELGVGPGVPVGVGGGMGVGPGVPVGVGGDMGCWGRGGELPLPSASVLAVGREGGEVNRECRDTFLRLPGKHPQHPLTASLSSSLLLLLQLLSLLLLLLPLLLLMLLISLFL